MSWAVPFVPFFFGGIGAQGFKHDFHPYLPGFFDQGFKLGHFFQVLYSYLRLFRFSRLPYPLVHPNRHLRLQPGNGLRTDPHLPWELSPTDELVIL